MHPLGMGAIEGWLRWLRSLDGVYIVHDKEQEVAAVREDPGRVVGRAPVEHRAWQQQLRRRPVRRGPVRGQLAVRRHPSR